MSEKPIGSTIFNIIITFDVKLTDSCPRWSQKAPALVFHNFWVAILALR